MNYTAGKLLLRLAGATFFTRYNDGTTRLGCLTVPTTTFKDYVGGRCLVFSSFCISSKIYGM